MATVKQIAMHQLRQSRIADGMCAKCGNNPVGVNMDGSQSVYCNYCRPNSRKRASKVEVEEVEFHTPLADQPKFQAFAARMIETLKALDHEPSQREFRQLLGVGDNDIERRWWNAVVSYNFEDMEEFQHGMMTRYRARILRRTPEPSTNPPMHIRRGRGINLTKTETQITPDVSSYQRRVTA